MAEPIGTGSTIAGYRLVAVIGRGGMGVVYRADQPELDRQVAIKLIAPELARDDAYKERFRRESRLAATIEHPNAIPIYDAGVTDDGVLYLAMRYVEGIDMRSLIANEGRLEAARAARLIEQVAGALDEAHAHGLVHRDVKPGNVLVSQRRAREHVYLTDFGLTKHVAGVSSLTKTGQWVGTVDYACPEQIEGKPVDARADVYALGCVLFESLTGRVPFERESELAKLFAHANDEPPRASTVADMPPELDDVIARSLAKDPDERFPSAGDLGRAAAAAAVGRDVSEPERTVAAGAAAPTMIDGKTVEATPPAPTVPATPEPETPPPPAPEPPADDRTVEAPPAPTDAKEPVARTDATEPLAEEPASAESVAPERASAESAPAEAPSAPTAPLSVARGGLSRRTLLGILAGGVAVAAAIGAVFAFGLIGGEEGPEQVAEPVNFRDAFPGGEYAVELPDGWTDEETEREQNREGLFRTRRLNPEMDVRLGIGREAGDGSTDLDDAVADAEATLEERFDNYERLGLEEAEVGGNDARVLEFEARQDNIGPEQEDDVPIRAVAYFLNVGDDAFRIQGNAPQAAGEEAFEIAEEVAERAASTLREVGG